ncbi:MAG: hypothetical protein HYT65_03165 [Candidatus Yanofskybacteria bacterium]|nr:hypothetical protein [Candidatus Yanofskybacteria bacterium]
MMTKRKKVWSIVLILAIALIVFVLVNKRDGFWPANPTPSGSVNEGVGPTTSQLRSGTAALTKKYTELVSQYQGKHFQFDMNCQMIPNYSTFKNGTAVMFDNRSGDARYIVIGGNSYYFPGYGYKILPLSNSKVPYTVNISKCGAAVNVGSILLQK